MLGAAARLLQGSQARIAPGEPPRLGKRAPAAADVHCGWSASDSARGGSSALDSAASARALAFDAERGGFVVEVGFRFPSDAELAHELGGELVAELLRFLLPRPAAVAGAEKRRSWPALVERGRFMA